MKSSLVIANQGIQANLVNNENMFYFFKIILKCIQLFWEVNDETIESWWKPYCDVTTDNERMNITCGSVNTTDACSRNLFVICSRVFTYTQQSGSPHIQREQIYRIHILNNVSVQSTTTNFKKSIYSEKTVWLIGIA